MYGIWSSVSKQFVFGIQEPSKTKAWEKLRKLLGRDAGKVRFRCKRICEEHKSMFKQGLKYREGE